MKVFIEALIHKPICAVQPGRRGMWKGQVGPWSHERVHGSRDSSAVTLSATLRRSLHCGAPDLELPGMCVLAVSRDGVGPC